MPGWGLSDARQMPRKIHRLMKRADEDDHFIPKTKYEDMALTGDTIGHREAALGEARMIDARRGPRFVVEGRPRLRRAGPDPIDGIVQQQSVAACGLLAESRFAMRKQCINIGLRERRNPNKIQVFQPLPSPSSQAGTSSTSL